jgi:hypothetical protein
MLTSRFHRINQRFPRKISSQKTFWTSVISFNGPYKISQSNVSTNLKRLLLLNRRSLCTEPRDRVYAILGLLPAHERVLFPVDYTTSVKEVFTNVVENILTATDRLDIIRATFHYPYHSNAFSLPSWVSFSPWKSVYIHIFVKIHDYLRAC